MVYLSVYILHTYTLETQELYMVDYNLERARLAVQYLVDTPYFTHRVKGLRSALSKPRSLPFRDEAEVLNELLIIGRQNEQAMENLVAVAELKRDDRSSYQRDFMRAKRQRERLFIKLKQLDIGRKLAPDERYQVLQKQYAVWEQEKLRFVDARCNRMINDGDVPTGEDRYKFTREFWTNVEDSLVQEISKLEAIIAKRGKVRIVQGVNKVTQMSKAFTKAVDKGK